MLDVVRLGEKSSAVTSWHDQLYLAWTGSDLHINLASSPDGCEISGKQQLGQRSYTHVAGGTSEWDAPLAPSLAVSGERLYLAWTGSDLALNVLAAEQPAHAAPVTSKKASADGPSLTTAEDGNLVLAWTGVEGRC